MSIEQDPVVDEDEYDEEADSDFEGDGANEGDVSPSSSSDEEDDTTGDAIQRPRKKQKRDQPVHEEDAAIELDSGDEATIKEQKRTRRKQKKRVEEVDAVSDEEGDAQWRAKTRSMREREKEEKKFNRLARIEGSTINVDKVWEEMNRPGPLPPIRMEGVETLQIRTVKDGKENAAQDKENIPALEAEEMITIKRKFKFAGEVHVEEKIVPRSSAEAQLWLAQQEAKPQPVEEGGTVAQRPLRKISRFDPNYNNLAAFKKNWSRGNIGQGVELFKGPKLNVVEKSKIDWASHVDAEGLKDELDEHAKAKEGYHSRMEFLSQVELRKEEEARQARLKG